MPLTESDERKERLGRRVDEDEMMPAVDEPLQHSNGIAADRHALDVEGELLLGEPAGGVVVLERHLGAGDAVILRLDMKARQRDRPLHLLLQIADGHLDHLRRLRCGRSGWCLRRRRLGLLRRSFERRGQEHYGAEQGGRK